MESINNKGAHSKTSVCLCVWSVASHRKPHTYTYTVSTVEQGPPSDSCDQFCMMVKSSTVYSDLCGATQHTSLLLTHWEMPIARWGERVDMQLSRPWGFITERKQEQNRQAFSSCQPWVTSYITVLLIYVNGGTVSMLNWAFYFSPHFILTHYLYTFIMFTVCCMTPTAVRLAEKQRLGKPVDGITH